MNTITKNLPITINFYGEKNEGKANLLGLLVLKKLKEEKYQTRLDEILKEATEEVINTLS